MKPNCTIEDRIDRMLGADPGLLAYRGAIEARRGRLVRKLEQIVHDVGSLDNMSRGHEYFGFNSGVNDGQQGIWYREWAPGAKALYLIGSFNRWNRKSHPLIRDRFGVWSIFLPAGTLKHGTRLKVNVITDEGAMDRIPAYMQRVERDERDDYSGVFWEAEPYRWRHEAPRPPRSLRIYEAHVGMAQEAETIGSFDQFADETLPRIAKLGYNAIQLMGILHHPYYASFGYHVSNFFAVCDHFGTPDQLRRLIDTAHGLGIQVFLDIIHSHTVKNTNEGLNLFDGTSYQYFHAGGRGEHLAWDSKLFDYGKFEVLRFLLSNVRFWLTEYKFDGLRFDGVTSMIYLDHGLHRNFGQYHEYFDDANIDNDAVVYLQLANLLAHEIRSDVTTIAEEVSGMPGIARPIEEGGMGFDYRLAMGVPDNWIRLLKEVRDEHWPLEETFKLLTSRREGEKTIAYCESHDQALVGDKTIAFRLMDAHMYSDMAIDIDNHLVDRGVALHKMIRLLTYSFGGEAWLNFMGNEFGHPEWIDFPRDGNDFSYKYARRQWSLVDSPFLRYQQLNSFDKAMHRLEDQFHLLSESTVKLIHVDEEHNVLVARRGKAVLVFNFHPCESFPHYRIGLPGIKDYRIVLSTDDKEFGGFKRVTSGQVLSMDSVGSHGQMKSICAYLPARTALVLAPVLL